MTGSGTAVRTTVSDGLAVHERGEGRPVLLMPYSHAFTSSPMVEGPLAEALSTAGRRVVTFDPPGAYASTRTPVMDVDEMVTAALEALMVAEVTGRVDIVGHSTGGLCAAALAWRLPARTHRLLLVAPTGVGDASRLRALPFGWTDRRFWRFYRHALPVYGGRGTVAQHRAVYDLLVPALYGDPDRCPPLDPGTGNDEDAAAPPRAAMLRGVPRLGREELGSITARTCLVAGAADPIFPLGLAERVTGWMPRARLAVVEGAGHYPCEEAPEEFAGIVAGFLGRPVVH